LIVVCGEALIDVVETGGGAERVLPGGGPFNTARALARLGVPVAFFGRLSGDEHGLELASLLAADGVSLDLASFGPERTTVARARVGRNGVATYQFEIAGTAAPNLRLEMLPAPFDAGVEAIHTGSLGLVLEPMASTLVELVRRQTVRRAVVLDPNVRPGLMDESEYRERLRTMVRLSTIVKASETDLAWMYPGTDHVAAAESMLREGVGLVAVTLGAGGAFGAHAGARARVAAPRVDVVDTIGAGDAFGAALVAWLHDHRLLSRDLELTADDLRAALEYACLAASLTCTRPGAQPPTRREMAAARP
jgi:fructokinase